MAERLPLGRREAALAAVAAAGIVCAATGALVGAAAALFVWGFALAFRRPALVAPFLALTLPVGFSIATVHGVQVALIHAAVVGAAGGYLLGPVRLQRRPELGWADWAFAAFVVGVAISGLGPVAKGRWFHDLVFWGGLLCVFHCASHTSAVRTNRRWFYLAFGAAGLTEAVYGIAQYVEAAPSRFFRLGGAIVFPQPDGTLQHPNSLGAFLVFCMLAAAGAALAERGRLRWLGAAVVVVLGIGTLAPFSRGAWISLAGGVAALVVAERRHRRVLGGAAAGLALAAAALAAFDHGPLGARIRSLGSRDASSLYGFRWTLAKRAAHIVVHHPLTGAGRFNESGMYAGRLTVATHPHDLLLGVAVFFGIPAAVAFVALLAAAVRAAWRSARSAQVEGAAAFAVLVALLVNGLFEYPFWNSALAVQIVLVLALAAALDRAQPLVDVTHDHGTGVGAARARR